MDIFAEIDLNEKVTIDDKIVKIKDISENNNTDIFVENDTTISSDPGEPFNEGSPYEKDINTKIINETSISDKVLLSENDNNEEISSDNYDESRYFETAIAEVGRRLWKSDSESQCYLKGCLWSPDGTCVLTAANMDGMHVIEIPQTTSPDKFDEDFRLSKLPTAVHVPEAGAIYDYVWYPLMNSEDPNSCWFVDRYFCFYLKRNLLILYQ